MNTDLPGSKLSDQVSKQVFTYKGLQVEERICLWIKPDTYKLIWCLAPLESTVHNGVVNPVAHSDFVTTEHVPGSDWEQMARGRVKQEFDDYWFDTDGKQTSRTIEQFKDWKAGQE